MGFFKKRSFTGILTKKAYWNGYQIGRDEAASHMNNAALLRGNEVYLRENAKFGKTYVDRALQSGKARGYRAVLHRMGYKDTALIDYKKGGR
jgi:hypothetical protein